MTKNDVYDEKMQMVSVDCDSLAYCFLTAYFNLSVADLRDKQDILNDLSSIKSIYSHFLPRIRYGLKRSGRPNDGLA